ncbi:MAG: hypothetical protein QXM31_03570 [Candidatus Woesearchaeota archaeon]
MQFKDTLKQKVPEHLQQTPEFPIILKMLGEAKISGAESLRHWLNVEMQKCQNDLKEYDKAGPTMNRKRIRCVERMDILKMMQDKILPYLK